MRSFVRVLGMCWPTGLGFALGVMTLVIDHSKPWMLIPVVLGLLLNVWMLETRGYRRLRKQGFSDIAARDYM